MSDPLRALLVRDDLRPFFLDGHGLHLLDQRDLPAHETWRVFGDGGVIEGVARSIEGLAVRGAPAIGGAAALALAAFARRPRGTLASFVDTLKQHDARLRRTRPTAVNLFVALDAIAAARDAAAGRADARSDDVAVAVVDAAEAYCHVDEAACTAMGAHGAALLDDGDVVVTVCHTGALATCGQGTALGVVKSARKAGKDVAVVALETRPLLQGARLTAWECQRDRIPVTLITDGMAAFALNRGLRGRRIARALVGADRIARNGDTANKIGTFALAVACAHHDVPFHVVAPTTTFDETCPDGHAIPIEERAADEVRSARGAPLSPVDVGVWNPAFDVTPASLVTGFVTERGLLSRGASPARSASPAAAARR
ncbi:MAG: S-methyl-5-thioribose-1-phosphate isomerase [Deltaproteobacteria bacterium]|nr:S-methyl-5-thioribose-1-phosphate isomerase [Deltaproteobacteria bacterium]